MGVMFALLPVFKGAPAPMVASTGLGERLSPAPCPVPRAPCPCLPRGIPEWCL